MTIPTEILDLDRALVAVAPRVKVLSSISWPEATVQSFLTAYRSGSARVPESPQVRATDLGDVREELARIHDEAPTSHPLGRFVGRTAASYAAAAKLLQTAGTNAFVETSRELYGAPDDPLPGGGGTHAEVADRLLEVTSTLVSSCEHEADLICLTAHHVRDELARATADFFGEGVLDVVVDDNLAAKAAASADRVRIRGKTCFSQADIDQLLQHEAFVHSATALNGRRQPIRAFGLAAPRTTATQEGLATLAELTTGSMDLSRLRRIALRIAGVDRALDGADFVEVFRYYVSEGQSEDESARSAMRVFRGGDPRGRIAFTKDVVYLRGLIGVHTFLRRAIRDGELDLVQRLFIGRIALRDVVELAPVFAAGDTLVPPRYVPPWAADPRRLASYLALSLVWARIAIEDVALETILEPSD